MDEWDAVMGSRIMDKRGARRAGMPLYKLVGNRILTRVENALASGNQERPCRRLRQAASGNGDSRGTQPTR